MRSRAGSRSNAGVQRRIALLAELSAARTDLLAALNDVPPELALTPGIVGSWSARDLVVHVAFWSDHAADALALATSGRGAEFVYDASQTDAMNDDVFRAGRGLAMDDAMAREEAAFRRFDAALAGIPDAMIDLRLGNGDTVEAVVRYDGADHFAEHAGQLRAWFDGGEEPADDE